MKFLYIKDNDKGFKEYNLKAIPIFIVSLIFVGVIAFAGYQFGYYNSSIASDYELKANNDRNARDESILLEKISDLDFIEKRQLEIIKRDSLLRNMIGLPQIDSDIYETGTGGKSDIVNEVESDLIKKINHLKQVTNLETISYTDITSYIEKNLNKILRIPAIHPVKMNECKMTSGYGKRMHPTLNRIHMHDGDDFAPIDNFWNTEVYATADGRVKKSIYLPDTYGHYIEIDHGDGIVTAYAHLRLRNVRKGQKVKRGQKIGIMGSTGLSTSVHLHYEVKKNGRAMNPRQYYFDQTSL